ncbi:MAG: MBL fold metallo-hydrolase [Deltaproteobacteria bacterium]|nr:MBL fold metallo-hydrolase [Deltaproteobacteria bacterium]
MASGTLQIDFLGSGSAGNATLLRCADQQILIDAGFDAATLSERLEQVGSSPAEITDLLITHLHDDHVIGAAALAANEQLRIYGLAPAIKRASVRGNGWRRHYLSAGQVVDLGACRLWPFAVPHDSRGGALGFRIETPCGERLGFATDIGAITAEVIKALSGCTILAIEANHDRERLWAGPYPQFLKHRIASQRGHLSNADAARLLRRVLSPALRAVYAIHLSETNNCPKLVRDALSKVLPTTIGLQIVEQHRVQRYPPAAQQLPLFAACTSRAASGA